MSIQFFNRHCGNRGQQTIVIQQEEDSLLQNSHIAQFIDKESSRKHTKNSNMNEYTDSKVKLTIFKNPLMAKLSNTSEGFFRQKQKLIKPLKFTYFEENPPQIKQKGLVKRYTPLRGKRKASCDSFQSSQKDISSLIRKRREIMNLMDSKKQWSTQMLRKTMLVSKKKLGGKSMNTFSSNQFDLKNRLENNFQEQILKKVENSTWLRLNPQKIKQSLITLSKSQKKIRRSFFANKQAEQSQTIGIKSINKIALLRISSESRSNYKPFTQRNLLQKNLSSKQLINHKIYDRKIKRAQQLEKRGVLNPFRQLQCSKHDYLGFTERQFI